MRPQTKGLARCVPDRCVLTLGRIQAVGNHNKKLGLPCPGSTRGNPTFTYLTRHLDPSSTVCIPRHLYSPDLTCLHITLAPPPPHTHTHTSNGVDRRRTHRQKELSSKERNVPKGPSFKGRIVQELSLGDTSVGDESTIHRLFLFKKVWWPYATLFAFIFLFTINTYIHHSFINIRWGPSLYLTAVGSVGGTSVGCRVGIRTRACLFYSTNLKSNS